MHEKIADLNEQIRKLKITNQMLFRADERPSSIERGARIADYNAYAEHIVGERQKGEELSRQLQSEKIVSQGLKEELSVLKGKHRSRKSRKSHTRRHSV